MVMKTRHHSKKPGNKAAHKVKEANKNRPELNNIQSHHSQSTIKLSRVATHGRRRPTLSTCSLQESRRTLRARTLEDGHPLENSRIVSHRRPQRNPIQAQ
ncbi:hypothetical protein L484_010595 [Morus notabilis]|uniref:Uncharacterized protein n=1 Tax=Morus notabilis TaxID=981085 RepID=W9QKZ8_9ROSA|nr:hypothetical protein L484_010595 [Morus notabilis]